MVQVIQLSDTHFTVGGERTHGGIGHDTAEAFEAVLEAAFEGHEGADLVVVTGDIADRGQPDQYLKAADALAQIPVATYVLTGNHDFQAPFQDTLLRRGVMMPRTLAVENWLFLFVDTNANGRMIDGAGHLVDRPDRVGADAGLGEDEVAWIDETLANSGTDHAFVWLHHPPAMPGMFSVPSYDAELAPLIERHGHLRGIAGGHVHTDRVGSLAGCPIYVCPALAVNIDLDTNTTLPPGFRTFDFHSDGSISTTAHLVEDPRWPRRELPDVVMEYLHGRISREELLERL